MLHKPESRIARILVARRRLLISIVAFTYLIGNYFVVSHSYGLWRPFETIAEFLRKGKAVGVHCRAGIGRSSMIVASALIQNGLSVDSAFRSIQESRGCSVPGVERYSSRSGLSEE